VKLDDNSPISTGQRMLELGAAAVERQRVRLGGGDLGACARDVELATIACAG